MKATRSVAIVWRSLVAVLAVWTVAAPSYGAAADRPNLLFAFADDWGRYASIYAQLDGPGRASDVVRTPNIDRAAREGVLFRNAFVNAPSCTPCRSSLLSGQYFWRTGRGAILRGAVWDPAIPSYPLLLHDAGYHIGKSYKVWGPGTPKDAPYGEDKHAFESAGGAFNSFSQQASKLVKQGVTLDAAKARLLDQVRANFAAMLDAREPGQPFCYWFGPTNVHRKWVQGSGKALWGLDPEELKGKLPAFLPDVPVVREDFADYLGEAMAFDAAVGVLQEELARRGETENTLLAISGDHGAPGFPRGKCNLYDFGVAVPLIVSGPGVPGGRVVDDLVTLVDLAPTFLDAAGETPPGVMTGRSLMPVLRSDKSGQVDPERTWVVTGRERHVESARPGNLPYPQRAIRTRDHLFIINFEPDRWPMGSPMSDDPPSEQRVLDDTRAIYADMDASPTKAWLVSQRDNPEWARDYNLAFGKRPREELYVLNSDPDQVNNVSADPRHAGVVAELRTRLMDELRRTGDPRVAPGKVVYEHPPFTGDGSD
ncbi:Sulfatase [Pirellulimonas nuda]|uniref:Sulfatase n=1 Tax=Pirellulimonas nuda TaxID=2528009 RepID=A0A518D8G2_9BACT|nr:sulfatase [Pirellulimonas nuda]QDU87744.1 Sulfatase [Pirellulimonas nuda]